MGDSIEFGNQFWLLWYLHVHFKLIYINDVPEYWTTPIIEDPDYIRFSSYWDDLFTTGFLPLAISMFFNLRIYLKVIILIHFKFDDMTYIKKRRVLWLLLLKYFYLLDKTVSQDELRQICWYRISWKGYTNFKTAPIITSYF